VPISHLVLPHDRNCNGNDEQCALHLSEFEAITDAMRNGSFGVTNFSRTTEDGSIEMIYMAFAPVELKDLRPIDSSDFARGIEQSDVLVYSLGLAETEEGMLMPFRAIVDPVNETMTVAITVLSVVVFLAIALVVCLSRDVVVSISVEMLLLLELIKKIQRCVRRRDGMDNASNPDALSILGTDWTLTMSHSQKFSISKSAKRLPVLSLQWRHSTWLFGVRMLLTLHGTS
jgi:hypothetical protein